MVTDGLPAMTGVFWLFRHCVGIDDGLVAKLFQSGIGTAAPTQTSCASVVLKPASREQLAAMLDGMRLFRMGYSWGGFESLIIPTDPDKLRTASRFDAGGPCLRLHIGLEDPDDLIADLDDLGEPVTLYTCHAYMGVMAISAESTSSVVRERIRAPEVMSLTTCEECGLRGSICRIHTGNGGGEGGTNQRASSKRCHVGNVPPKRYGQQVYFLIFNSTAISCETGGGQFLSVQTVSLYVPFKVRSPALDALNLIFISAVFSWAEKFPLAFENTLPVSYTHLRAHETVLDLVCRLLLEKKNQNKTYQHL